MRMKSVDSFSNEKEKYMENYEKYVIYKNNTRADDIQQKLKKKNATLKLLINFNLHRRVFVFAINGHKIVCIYINILLFFFE